MKRGRKTVDDLNVIVGDFGKYDPVPPADLSERQVAIWRSVVASEPRGYFESEALRGLLADYCRHRESGEKLSEIINSFQPEWLKSAEGSKRYKCLIQMRDLETRAAMSLATKMRLTNQSRYTPQAAATASRNAKDGIARPWEI